MNDTSITNDIYEQLNNKELTSKLEDIIEHNSIPHTTNTNGIFINISVLDKEHLRVITEYLIHETDRHTISQEEQEEKNHPLCNFLEIKGEIRVIDTPLQKTIKLTALQQKIIGFSL